MTNHNDINGVIESSKQLWGSGKHWDAIIILDRCISINNDSRLYYARGRHQDMLGHPDSAANDFTLAIQLDPRNPNYYMKRACIYAYQLHNAEQAIYDFKNAIKLEYENVDAHQQVCLCLLLTGRISDAQLHAKTAILLSPDDSLSHYCQGECLMSQKQYNEAINEFYRAVELDAECSTNWSSLGRACVHVVGDNHLLMALNAYTKAIEIDANMASLFEARADVYMKLGQLESAKDDLQRGLSLNPSPATMSLIEIALKSIG